MSPYRGHGAGKTERDETYCWMCGEVDRKTKNNICADCENEEYMEREWRRENELGAALVVFCLVLGLVGFIGSVVEYLSNR